MCGFDRFLRPWASGAGRRHDLGERNAWAIGARAGLGVVVLALLGVALAAYLVVQAGLGPVFSAVASAGMEARSPL